MSPRGAANVACERCRAVIDRTSFASAWNVCPVCDFHHRQPPEAWRRLLLDAGRLDRWDTDLAPKDTLSFVDGGTYPDHLAAVRARTGLDESVETGAAEMDGHRIAYGAFAFEFMGGSMGTVAGERLARLFDRACDEILPVLIVSASGGARMQEGILSLMQMASVMAAHTRLAEARLPLISVLTSPTTGAVAASFAFQGDVNLAEPGARIGFAGPRVVAATLGEELPAGTQLSEFALAHGMVDMVVARADLRARVVTILRLLAERSCA